MTSGAQKYWSSVDWSGFVATLGAAQTVVVCGHVRPDGDTIGSCLAMKRALESLGKKVLAIDGYDVPPSLKFLDPNSEIRKISTLSPEERAFVDSADVLMSLDVSAEAQLGPDAYPLFVNAKGKVVVIDHHEVGGELGDVRCVDGNADSAGSLVFEAIVALGVVLSYEIAFPLYVAIATDTGFFRFASTNSGTFERAATLTAAGVKVDEVYRLVEEQESFGRFRLLGRVATTSERFLGDRGVFMRLSWQDFVDAGAIAADSEDLVNAPLSVGGTEVAVIAIEQSDRATVKVSFRSRCELDCARLAKEFGGGGHRRAAGATLKTPLDEACEALKAKTQEYYAALGTNNE